MRRHHTQGAVAAHSLWNLFRREPERHRTNSFLQIHEGQGTTCQDLQGDAHTRQLPQARQGPGPLEPFHPQKLAPTTIPRVENNHTLLDCHHHTGSPRHHHTEDQMKKN